MVEPTKISSIHPNIFLNVYKYRWRACVAMVRISQFVDKVRFTVSLGDLLMIKLFIRMNENDILSRPGSSGITRGDRKKYHIDIEKFSFILQ